jgi:hypothetical protein
MSGANIDWTLGQKFLCITPATWQTKHVGKRVELAKEDLRKQGHHADADVLTDTRLNTAWMKLSKEVRANHMAKRALDKTPEQPSNAAAAAAAKGKKADRDDRRRGT